MLTALRQLLTDWWQVDRVRTTPWEGRILNLQPGQHVLICWIPFVIQSRTVGHSDRFPVQYRLTGDSEGCLQVETIEGRLLGRLQSGDEPRSVSDEDIIVLSAPASSDRSAGVS